MTADKKNTNYIDSNLELFLNEETTILENTNFSDLKFTGQLFGMVEKGEPISKEETMIKLQKAADIDELIRIARYIVGPLWVYARKENTVHIVSSASAPSLYIYRLADRLVFSKFEKEICTFAIKKEKLNACEVFDIFNTVRLDSTPYAALFEKIFRFPDSHVLTINSDLEYSYTSYLDNEPEPGIQYNYQYFKSTLEAIAKLYVDSGKDIYVYFSGGIDSFVVYLALKRFSDNIIPIATCQDLDGSTDGGHIHQIIATLENEFDIHPALVYADRYSEEQRTIRDEICKLCSSNCARWDSFVFYSIMEAFENRDDLIFVTGQEMDDGYGIAFTKFRKGNFNLLGTFGRFFYAKPYQRNLDGYFNKMMRNIAYNLFPNGLINGARGLLSGGLKNPFKNRNKDIDPKVEYLSAMCYMHEYQDSYFPIIKNMPNYEKDFLYEYTEYKKGSLLRSAFNSYDEIKDVPKKDINKKIRILRHYFSVPNVLRGSVARDHLKEQRTYHLPTEGPMIDLFCNLQLTWKDVYSSKRFLNMYFKERTGKEHFRYFSKKKLKQYNKIAHDKTIGNNLWVKKADFNAFLSSDVYQADFNKYVDLHNPSVLKYIDSPFVEKYVRQCYKDAIKGLLSYNELQNIYNIELFIKDIENKR